MHGFSLAERNAEESSQEDCLFSLDDDSSEPDVSPSPKKSTMRSTYGFSLDSRPERRDFLNHTNRTQRKTEVTGSRLGSRQISEGNQKESLRIVDLGSLDNHPKGAYLNFCFPFFIEASIYSRVFNLRQLHSCRFSGVNRPGLCNCVRSSTRFLFFSSCF